MREIKFRAWDKELKIMDYGKELTGGIEYECSPVRALNIILNEDDHGFVYMQYTGLKDKNGKEIFEGDIVQQNYRDVYNQKQAFTGEVVYADCVYWLKNGDEYTFLYDEHRIYHSVVIGNIHEKPELLEVAG